MKNNSAEIPPWMQKTQTAKISFQFGRASRILSYPLDYVAELHRELDYTSRIGREDISSDGQQAVESYPDFVLLSTESLETAANSTENDRYTRSRGVATPGDPDDRLDGVTSSIDKILTAKTPCRRVYMLALTPSPSLPDSYQEQRSNKGLSLHILAKQYCWADIEGQHSLIKGKKTIPPSSIFRPQKTALLMETGS